MDPSEFEGIVDRVSDPLTFSNLEQLLAANNNKFVKMDLSKESDEIYVAVFKIKESSQKWDEVSFNSLRLAWDEQAIKIAEYKESMAAKKKVLASKTRNLLSLLSASPKEEGSDDDADLAGETKELISAFKAEFDFLSLTNRFSESAFLSTYKILRDIPDPSEEMRDCLTVCIKAQETLKNAQEQMNIASGLLETKDDQSQPAMQKTIANNEILVANHNSQIEELKKKNQSEIALMRDKNDLEMTGRERFLRSTLETQQMEFQQQYEDSLARKEVELSSLTSSLNAFNLRTLEDKERHSMLDSELQKRRDLEERLRTSLTELAGSQTLTHEIQAKYDTYVANTHTLERQCVEKEKVSENMMNTIRTEHAEINQKLLTAESELRLRPPVDLSALAERLGMVGGFENDGSNQLSLGGDLKMHISWTKIETVIINSIRRASNDATDSRVKEQEVIKSLKGVKEECDQIRSTLSERDTLVSALEKDLVVAYAAVEATKALIKSSNHSNKKRNVIAVDDDDDYDTSNFLRTPESAVNDIEKGSDFSDTPSGGDRMIQAIQGQRDRFMTIAHKKNGEFFILEKKLELALEEQKALRNENLELFKRLRLARASGGGGVWGGEEDTNSKSLHRRDRDKGTNRIEDPLDRKYMHLYEEKIDPFQLEELDRQNLLSHMNIFERGLAHATRFFLQDRWARHALLVYLVIVHCFALGYVLQVLNPQLTEEVNSHMKDKWSAQTLDYGHDREHPDVRYRRY